MVSASVENHNKVEESLFIENNDGEVVGEVAPPNDDWLNPEVRSWFPCLGHHLL